MAKRKEFPLDDLTVVEIGDAIAPAYAGRLLADLGATVVRIEDPDGGMLYRSGPRVGHDHTGLGVGTAYLHLNRGKRSVGLRLEAEGADEPLDLLVRNADVLVDGTACAWTRRAPRLCDVLGSCPLRLLTVTISPFGLSGPYRWMRSSDLVVMALGGLLNMVGEPDDRPLLLGGWQDQYIAGTSAFTGLMAALAYRDRTGKGQAVDVSMLEAVAFTEWKSGAYFEAEGRLRRRSGSRSEWLVLPARDGHVALVYQDESWAALQGLSGIEALDQDRFATRACRGRHAAELVELLEPWSRTKRKEEIYHLGQQVGIPLGMVATVDDLLSSPQYREREFWHTVEHPATGPGIYPGVPYKAGWTTAPGVRAPIPGEHTFELLGAAGYLEEELDELRALGVI